MYYVKKNLNFLNTLIMKFISLNQDIRIQLKSFVIEIDSKKGSAIWKSKSLGITSVVYLDK